MIRAICMAQHALADLADISHSERSSTPKMCLQFDSSHPPSRVVIEGVCPEIDAGRFPIKRTPGEEVIVEADIHADGHDQLAAVLRYRCVSGAATGNGEDWNEVPMQPLGNDRWTASFGVAQMGRYEYTIQAWIDVFGSWRRDLSKKFDAGQDVNSELLEGAALLTEAANRTTNPEDVAWLKSRAARLRGDAAIGTRVNEALDQELASRMLACSDRGGGTTLPSALPLIVDCRRARYGAWYEMFPRSTSDEPGRHGTFRDAERRLPEIAEMGFDVVYLPPIHPIGRTFRKGPNNSLIAGPNDPGCPWAIGAAEGGHKSILPELGTLKDFDHFVATANELQLEIALDFALQCSPDHPYVREHPDWFRHRPDGTIKYAENPPKKYQDIYPINFECADWRNLWDELKSIVLFWIEHGVTIFRVDNPHTKPYRFWEWLIAEVQKLHPETIFLAEAFTRPKIMRHLAKLGFSQSYTYFTWRNTKAELTEYLTELTQTDVRETMRPNFFVNTPDILHEYLQVGGRPAFQCRLVLAATLGATYGIYGPPFELCEGRAVGRSEEYLDSEKYQIRTWDRDRPGNIRDFISRINRIRRENTALHHDWRLKFHPTDNEQLICYSKSTTDLENIVLVVVNLDPHHVQSGWVDVPVQDWGLAVNDSYQVHDLINDARYLWQGAHNFVQLNPAVCPAHVFRVRK
jgi:starch synthase (maltosyl-transferring)